MDTAKCAFCHQYFADTIFCSSTFSRWRCGRSSVDRIANRAGLKKLYLGEGKPGIVRFIRKEVDAYEERIPN